MHSSVIILTNKLLVLNGFSVNFLLCLGTRKFTLCGTLRNKKVNHEPMFSSVKSISPDEIEEVNLNRQTLRTSCATLMEGSSDLF